MARTITARQLAELKEAYECLDDQQFIEKLEAYTGIVRKPYTAHNYFDANGNYVGCSEEFNLDEVLENAFVEVDYGSAESH